VKQGAPNDKNPARGEPDGRAPAGPGMPREIERREERGLLGMCWKDDVWATVLALPMQDPRLILQKEILPEGQG